MQPGRRRGGRRCAAKRSPARFPFRAGREEDRNGERENPSLLNTAISPRTRGIRYNAFCRIAPPKSYGGDSSKKQSRRGAKRPPSGDGSAIAMPNHGCLAWQSPVADSGTSGREGAEGRPRTRGPKRSGA